jgi:hypothetical protein
MTVLLGVDGPGVLYDTSFKLKVNTALYVYKSENIDKSIVV